MCKRLTSALLIVICSAFLSTQTRPLRDDGMPVVATPQSSVKGQWRPVVVIWWPEPTKLRDNLMDGLVARGFSVTLLKGIPDAEVLGKNLFKVRKNNRIAHGGVHALIAGGHAEALRSLLKHAHEFQSVTMMGDASGVNLKPLMQLRHRRVRAMENVDAEGVCEYMAAMHRQRDVPGPAKVVDETLDSFHDAAAVADEDRYFAIFPDDAVFLGTDATERWTGKEFRAFAMRYFARDSAWTYVPLNRHITLSPDGNVAWFDEVLENAGYGECRGSGALIKREGRWVLQQYNLTVPVPNDLMAGVAKQIRKHLSTDAERK